MPESKQRLEKQSCPVCQRRFRPRVKWQKYDRPRCTKAAFDARIAEKLRRLAEFEARDGDQRAS